MDQPAAGSDVVNAAALGRLLLERRRLIAGELGDAAEAGMRAPAEPPELLGALSEHQGMQAVDLRRVVVTLSALSYVARDEARERLVLPLLARGQQLFVAIADPTERNLLEELEFANGLRVRPYLAVHGMLRDVIEAAYAAHAAGASVYRGPLASRAGDGLEPGSRRLGVPEPGRRSMHERATLPAPGSAPAQSERVTLPAPGGVPQSEPATPPQPHGREVSPDAPSAGHAFDLEQLAGDRARLFALNDPPVLEEHGPPGGFGPDSPERAHGRLLREGTAPEPPRAEEPGAPCERQTAPEALTLSRRLLIVDDNDDIRRLLARVFRERDYEVIESARGLDALQKVRECVPDLVLLDAVLPEVHGFDLCRRIKASRRYGHTPIVMLSAVYRGWRFAEDLRRSYGVYEYLEKPFRINEVVAAVERALAGASKSQPPPEEDADEGPGGVHLRAGLDAYARGDLNTAVEHLQKGIAVDPRSFRLHYHLGLLYGKQENVFEAIQELESAVDLKPRDFSSLKNLAVLYQRAGFRKKATELWERALGSAPDDELRADIRNHLVSLL